MMPKLDGFGLLKELRADDRTSTIPVIMLSARAGEDSRVDGIVAGADDYLIKPFSARELVARVHSHINLSRARRVENRNASALRSVQLHLDGWVGPGEMSELIRNTDWAGTPLGSTASWSPALRMIVKFLLANRFPQLLWWGPEFCSIYNDAYIPILGSKHPWALGRPVREVWNEIWHVLKPLIETPFSGGPATWIEDIPLEINRRGFFEETHFTVAYSPVPDETAPNGIGGVLATVHEITDKIIGERRVSTLRDLGAGTAG